ncbi:three-Cys-motif partner protein TcmP [Sporocytophaga myxococcoides]|nr:three-Cys-motif partner protein TcmP [Sporocytophaga myxococcoides]
MARDLHKKGFDESTQAKLAIFRDYLKEWLPVFLSKKEILWDTVNIFDFFAGPGEDNQGNEGTPLIITQEINPYFDQIISKKIDINLYFNEYDKKKFNVLKERLIPETRDLAPYSIEIDNLDFKEAFNKCYPIMKNKRAANLLFLDQYGIKHINEEIFKKIIQLKATDFLFFISSSTIKRFSDHPEIAKYIGLDKESIESTPYYKIHKKVLEYYKTLIPANMTYHLAPFSLLKSSGGLYGLIFGSGHILGMEKFLTTCWKVDPERGEANFDIDDDRIDNQYDLFTGALKKPKKIEGFERELENNILNCKIKNDRDLYIFSITNGFTPSHTRKILTSLVGKKKIKKNIFDLSHRIIKKEAKVTPIELI